MKLDQDRGRKLKVARTEAGLSRRAAAEKLGVHRNSVHNWEKGMMPSEETVPAIMDLYGLEPGFFKDALSEFEQAVLKELTELRERMDALTPTS
jgi:transcriptional regulator with XRE-family HTH domain